MSNFKTLFKIVLCELFHPFIFGVDENSDKNINGHFIVLNTYKPNYKDEEEEEEEEEEYIEYEDGEYPQNNYNIFEIIEKDKKELNKQRRFTNKNHPLIRNYKKIVKNSLNFEIAHCVTLSGGEYVAILKTFWIKIIIRSFKKAFKKKMWKIYSQHLKGMRGSIHEPLLRGLLYKY